MLVSPNERLSLTPALRVGIDARYITYPVVGGFKTYIQELLAAFQRMAVPVELWLMLNDEIGLPASLSSLPRIVRHAWPPFAGLAWREQISLPRAGLKHGLDVMHYPSNTMPLRPLVPSVVTIHDLIALRRDHSPPGLRNRLTRAYQWLGLRAAMRGASLVITDSEHVATELRSQGVAASRVVVIPPGIGPGFHRSHSQSEIEEFRMGRDLTEPYLLTIASVDPRKNVVGALTAFSLLRARVPWLTLAILLSSERARDGLWTRATELGIADRIRFVSRVPDRDMPLLYAGAEAMLFLSLAEGFGLPPLESMASGTPVVCSDLPPLNSLNRGAALLVDPLDPGAAADAAYRLVSDREFYSILVEKGRRHAANFTWETTARQTLAAYGYAAAGPRSR